MKGQSLNPEAMLAHLNLYLTVMFGKSALTRPRREMIATSVSATNGCEYCLQHHGEALNFYWKDAARLKAFTANPENAKIGEADLAMLQYAIKLTRAPKSITEKDIQNLRKLGFSDRAILDVSLVAGYFNFVNRLALGLGVKFDPQEVSGYRY
jgi:uncharacterized peroxidase-related enzyme